jgi:hypothetical protein
MENEVVERPRTLRFGMICGWTASRRICFRIEISGRAKTDRELISQVDVEVLTHWYRYLNPVIGSSM